MSETLFVCILEKYALVLLEKKVNGVNLEALDILRNQFTNKYVLDVMETASILIAKMP